MPAILISWGETKPDQELVDLMLQKAKSFHVITSQVRLHYGYRWPKEDGTAESYDQECWHIRDDLCRAGYDSRGVEGCQCLLEGLNEGYALAKKQSAQEQIEKKAKIKKNTRVRYKNDENLTGTVIAIHEIRLHNRPQIVIDVEWQTDGKNIPLRWSDETGSDKRGYEKDELVELPKNPRKKTKTTAPDECAHYRSEG